MRPDLPRPRQRRERLENKLAETTHSFDNRNDRIAWAKTHTTYLAVREPPIASVTYCPRPEGDSPEITLPGGEVVRSPAGSAGGCRRLMRLEEVAHLVYRLGLYVF